MSKPCNELDDLKLHFESNDHGRSKSPHARSSRPCDHVMINHTDNLQHHHIFHSHPFRILNIIIDMVIVIGFQAKIGHLDSAILNMCPLLVQLLITVIEYCLKRTITGGCAFFDKSQQDFCLRAQDEFPESIPSTKPSLSEFLFS